MTNDNLSRVLREFDFKNKPTLPTELLTALQGNTRLCIDDGRGRNTIQTTELFFADQSLRANLAKSGKYTDRTRVVELYAYDQARKVFYDLSSGRKLGDELRINEWLSQPSN